jgi:heme exporter protein D
MKYGAYLWAILGLCLIAIAGLILKVSSVGEEMRNLNDKNSRMIAGLQDAVKLAQAGVSAAKESAPGLGEYMTTIQLHAGKLWFAFSATNWDLARYELDELKETMEAAKALNAEKNGVKVSNVLDAILQSQIVQLEDAIKHKGKSEFQKSYDATLGACNGCHSEAGVKFIHIVRPSAPPVTNQRWGMEAK